MKKLIFKIKLFRGDIRYKTYKFIYEEILKYSTDDGTVPKQAQVMFNKLMTCGKKNTEMVRKYNDSLSTENNKMEFKILLCKLINNGIIS